MTKKYFFVVLSFFITTGIFCVINFVAQIVLIFVDTVSRWESSSLLTLVLWFVTGVFASILTEAAASVFIAKEEITYPLLHTPILIMSIIAIVLAIVLMFMGELEADNVEFTLLFSNGYVFISYFIGTGAFSWIARKL